MERTRSSHIGIEGYVNRARETLFWPNLTTKPKGYIPKCQVCCLTMGKVSAALCEFDNMTLLVVREYCSNFIEVSRVNTVTFRAVIKELNAIFVCIAESLL